MPRDISTEPLNNRVPKSEGKPLQTTTVNLQAVAVVLKRHWPFCVLAALAAILQAQLYAHAEPNVFPDSWGYCFLAEAIAKGNWSHEGFAFRTPGYPTFLAAVFGVFGDRNWQAVVAVQFLVGFLIPMGLYLLFLPFARKPVIAAAGAAGFLLDRYTLSLQAVPLTEFLGAATLIFVLAVYVLAVRRKSLVVAPLVGMLVFINVIVRPSFQYLIFCMIVGDLAVELLYGVGRSQWRRLFAWNGLVFLTFQCGVWAWSSVVYSNTGVFAMSHQLGAAMTNHTGSMMECAPDKYATIRDAYVKARDLHKGNQINIFDYVDDALTSETGLKSWQLSLQFREINSGLIKRFPGRYFQQVRYAWSMLWAEPSSYVVDEKPPDSSPGGKAEPTEILKYLGTKPILRWIYGPLEVAVWGNTVLTRSVPWVMIALAGAGVFLRRKDRFAVLAILLPAGAVIYSTAVHAMVQFTEFGRYRLLVQTLWVSLCLALLFTVLTGIIAWVRKQIHVLAGEESTEAGVSSAARKGQRTKVDPRRRKRSSSRVRNAS